MRYHIIAFVCGYILDLIVGDPYWLYHPVRLIGNLIAFLEKRWNRVEYSEHKKRIAGKCLVVIVVLLTFMCTATILVMAYLMNKYLGVVIESIMTYQILATKCLKVESMKVYHALCEGDIRKARHAVAMIVGRDTQQLDETGVAKAAIETVAENTSDGVIAPMIYLAIGGPVFGWIYKAINTMDSMVGYKDEKYRAFGRCAAKLDDIVNYIPARLSAWGMIAVSGILGLCPIYLSDGKNHVYHGKQAFRIFKRDRYNHASPNSAQTEAVCAGALGIQLAGDASYFGKLVKKPYIGDATRAVECEDIRRANVLLYATSILCELSCLGIMILVQRILN